MLSAIKILLRAQLLMLAPRPPFALSRPLSAGQTKFEIHVLVQPAEAKGGGKGVGVPSLSWKNGRAKKGGT